MATGLSTLEIETPAEPEPFGVYQARCLDILRAYLAAAVPGSLDEQAYPAYVQGNPLSRRLFWKRIAFCHGYLERFRHLSPEQRWACLDFGCGSGLMLPRLSGLFGAVRGVDLETAPSQFFLEAWGRAAPLAFDRSRIIVSGSIDEAGLTPASLDLITALDVLEHVDDLPALVSRFDSLLKPGGRILVSGPTENVLYRLGRRIVGFSGHYHVRDIYDIRRELERHLNVTVLKRLSALAPLFLILEARKR